MPLDKIKLYPRERLELADITDLQNFITTALERVLESVCSPKDTNLQGRGRIIKQWNLSTPGWPTLTVGAGLGIAYGGKLLGHYPMESSLSVAEYTYNTVDPNHLKVWVREKSGGTDTDPAVRRFWGESGSYTQTVNTHTKYAWEPVIQSDSNPSPQETWIEIGEVAVDTVNQTITINSTRAVDYLPSGPIRNSITDYLHYHNTATPIDHPDGSITTAKIADSAITTPKIQDAAVTTAKIYNLAVTESKIADATITSVKFATGALVPEKRPPACFMVTNRGNCTTASYSPGVGGPLDWNYQGLIYGNGEWRQIIQGKYVFYCTLGGIYVVTATIPLTTGINAFMHVSLYFAQRDPGGGEWTMVGYYLLEEKYNSVADHIHNVTLTRVMYLAPAYYSVYIVNHTDSGATLNIPPGNNTTFSMAWVGDGSGRA